jgi:GNAT superfamily N-acetyltransferase
MTIAILPVQTEADKKAFYKFAFRVYKDDPNWVPHLWPQRKEYLDKKAAFFTYGEGEFWLAKDGNEIVGTIGTAIDHSRNRSMDWKAGIFGFFEVLPGRYEAAKVLWNFAYDWSRKKGMDELQGPYSFSGNDDPGFLVEGHQTMPSIMMGHNPAYYPDFAVRYGFEKLFEGLAYRYDFSTINYDVNKGPEIIHRIAARTRERHGKTSIRSPLMKDWDAEVDRLLPVYNKSLAVLPEFSPLEQAEFRAMAAGLRSVIDLELVFIAEVDGKCVGFGLGLPNITEALKYANGLQHPWDYVRFALAQKKIKSASFKILAIDPDYWGYGLEAVMFLEMGKALIRKGYTWVDASLTNEFNPQTNKLAPRLGAYVYRRYREYRLKFATMSGVHRL